jgi:hypothetical protein
LTPWEASLDTISRVSSRYTVRSITSFKERTSWFVRPRNGNR